VPKFTFTPILNNYRYRDIFLKGYRDNIHVFIIRIVQAYWQYLFLILSHKNISDHFFFFIESLSSRRNGGDPKVRLPFDAEGDQRKGEEHHDHKEEDSIQQMDFEDDYKDHHFTTTHDTGYQTNSLQSTNMGHLSTAFDPSLPHTNLTVQFGNMYGASDTGIEVEDVAPIPRKVTSLIQPTFTLIKNQESSPNDLSVLSDFSVVQGGGGDVPMPLTSTVRQRSAGVPVFPWKPDAVKTTNSAVIKEKIVGSEPASTMPASQYLYYYSNIFLHEHEIWI